MTLKPFVGMAANSAPPIQVADLNLCGVAAETALPGQDVRVWERLAITSEQQGFHRIADGLANILVDRARKVGVDLNIHGCKTILAIIKPDNIGDIYADTAAVAIDARIKRSMEAGRAVFAHDISDILAMRFPAITFEKGDRVIVLMREGWRYGIYFDLSGRFDQPEMEQTLGRMVRTLRYHESYAALANPEMFDRLIAAGWFPFIEINGEQFARLYDSVIADHPLPNVEGPIIATFTAERIDAMFDRWMRNAAFKKRETVLRPGLDAFLAGQSVLAIKTLMTEIEGILQDAHISTSKRKAKTASLIKFAVDEATKKAGSDGTLMFPAEFQRYLTENIYKGFDPTESTVGAARHAVGHGAASPDSYTQTRALQTILTLDQLSFYL